jgi:hypothetical protein
MMVMVMVVLVLGLAALWLPGSWRLLMDMLRQSGS